MMNVSPVSSYNVYSVRGSSENVPFPVKGSEGVRLPRENFRTT